MNPVLVICAIAAALPAIAQMPQFDVATVKISLPSPGDTISINLGTVRNGKVTLSNVTLGECLQFGWGLVSSEQLSGPDWIFSRAVRFDITAQADPATSREQLLIMLRNLLSERLKVEMHRQPKEMRYLALTTTKGGPKMRVADPANSSRNPSGAGRITANQMPMSVLAGLLSRFERQIVVDKTGLTGLFEFTLEWTPEDRPPADSATAPGLFTAVQQQLGLKLESQKGPIDVFVIDRAEKVPLEN